MNCNPIQNRTLLQKALAMVGLRNWAAGAPPVFDPRTLMTFDINAFPFSIPTNHVGTNEVGASSWQTVLTVPDEEFWLVSYVRANLEDGTWTFTAIGYTSVGTSGATIQMHDFSSSTGPESFRQRLPMGPGDSFALYVDSFTAAGDASIAVAVEKFPAPT